MALVTVSGFPCSGKTTRAREIAAYFEKRAAEVAAESGAAKYDVVVVDDESCHVTRAAYDGECLTRRPEQVCWLWWLCSERSTLLAVHPSTAVLSATGALVVVDEDAWPARHCALSCRPALHA